MKRFLGAMCILALTALISVSGLPQAQAQDNKVIKMGTMAWEDLKPMSLISKNVLEDAGYTVEFNEFSEWGIAFAAMTRGDIDILISQTDYVTQDYWDKNKNRLEKLSPVSYGLYQAFAVPSYVPINSVEELNENTEKFGGKIIGVEPGSGLMREATTAVDQYGLSLKLVDGSTAAMTAAVKSATDRQEWIVATMWNPSWMMLRYDMKFLSDPKKIFAPAQAYHWIARAGFSAENPHAREVLASVFVPIDDVAAMNVKINDGMTMEDAAQEWLTSNADLLARWARIGDKK